MIVQVAVNPFSVVTEIYAIPDSPPKVTFPFSSTLATPSLLLFHSSFSFVGSPGVHVANICIGPDDLDTVTEVGETLIPVITGLTDTTIVPTLPLSGLIAVTATVPFFFPMIVTADPSVGIISATLVSETVHFSAEAVRSEGSTVAVIGILPPSGIWSEFAERLIELMALTTFTIHCACLVIPVPSFNTTLMVASPSALAVTNPLLSTETFDGLSLVQLTCP